MNAFIVAMKQGDTEKSCKKMKKIAQKLDTYIINVVSLHCQTKEIINKVLTP